MHQLKRNISILLCLLLTFTVIFMAVPEEAQAATTYDFSGLDSYGSSDATVTISKGESNFYAGDLISVSAGVYPNRKNLGYLSNLKGVTYKSSNTSVAAIDNTTGKVTIKKTGTAKITMTYKSKIINFNLRVVSSAAKLYKEIAANYSNYTDDYGKTSYWKSTATAANKEAKAFLKKTGATVTINKSNRYKLISACKTASNHTYYNTNHYTSSYSYSCFDSGLESSRGYNEPTKIWLYSPDSLHARAIYEKICTYAAGFCSYSDKFNVLSSNWDVKAADNVFEIKSITGKAKSNTIKVTLKDKITADKIFALNFIYSWDGEVKEASVYTFPLRIQRTSTGHKYYAIATVKKGSNQMTIELQTTKLVKNAAYKVLFEVPSTYDSHLNIMSKDSSVGVDTFTAK